MNPFAVHYKNKYPTAQINETETSLDVFVDGEHRVALRKNGAGVWADHSEQLGCSDRHCTSPIPKESRVHKTHRDGRRGLDEKASERKTARGQFIRNGKIASIEELKAEGYQFDADGKMVASPMRALPASEPTAE